MEGAGNTITEMRQRHILIATLVNDLLKDYARIKEQLKTISCPIAESEKKE
jgi:hypothetical protein